jgi:tRNA pseudouridine55 synthase
MMKMRAVNNIHSQGLLLIDKPKGKSSFYLVKVLRSICKVKKIGHTGTLDPIASGLMILLIGKNYTTKAPQFLGARKTYQVEIRLGQSTDTYDSEGQTTNTSQVKPTLQEVLDCIEMFQGDQSQIPPMYCAKKVKGKKLYELARQNIYIERAPIDINLNVEFIAYNYPTLELKVECSSGTYIRTLCHDIGLKLKCFGYITELRRTQNGPYTIKDALTIETITHKNFQFENHLTSIL